MKYKFLQSFPLFVLAPVLYVLYSSRVAILRGKFPIISFLFVQTLKTLNGTSIRHRGLSARPVSTKIENFCSLHKPRTKSPPIRSLYKPSDFKALFSGGPPVKVLQVSQVFSFVLVGISRWSASE